MTAVAVAFLEGGCSHDLHVSDFGAVGDGIETEELRAAMEAAVSQGKRLLFDSILYQYDEAIYLDGDVDFAAIGAGRTELRMVGAEADGKSCIFIGATRAPVLTTTLAESVRTNSKIVTLSDTTGIEPGMLVQIRSGKSWYFDPRSPSALEDDAEGTAQGGSSSTITLKSGTVATDFVGSFCNIVGGTGAGQAREVVGYDNGSKVATVSPNWATAPNATSQYFFPLNRKGDLNRVELVDDDEVHLETATFDGYDIELETVVVDVYAPVSVSLLNINFTRSSLDTELVDVMQIFHAGPESVIERCRFDGGRRRGLWLLDCYQVVVRRCEFSRATAAATGYGAQTWFCNGVRFIECRCSRCRVGIDISGRFPSRLTEIEACSHWGGGDAGEGTTFEPNGNELNRGFGGHGCAEATTYRNCTVGNVGTGIHLQGLNHKVIGLRCFGHMIKGIRFGRGANATVRDVEYLSNFNRGSFGFGASNLFKEINQFAGAGSLRSELPDMLFEISDDWKGYVDIDGFFANSLQYDVVRFSGGQSLTHTDLRIANGMAYLDNTGSETPNHLLAVVGGGTKTLINYRESNAHIRCRPGPELVRHHADVNFLGVTANEDVVSIGPPEIYIVSLGNHSAKKIRIGRTATRIPVMVNAMNANTPFGFLMIRKDSAVSAPLGEVSGIETRATEPTGTSGNTGVATLHYGGDYLTLENRSGGTRRFMVTIYPGVVF